MEHSVLQFGGVIMKDETKTEKKIYVLAKKVYTVKRVFIGNISYENLIKRLILKEINAR